MPVRIKAVVLVSLLNNPLPPIGGDLTRDLDRIIARATARKPDRAISAGRGSASAICGRSPSGVLLKAPPISRHAVDRGAAVRQPEPAIADQEYFCDGMAEELINALSRVKGLRVASRTSAFQFKGRRSTSARSVQRLDVQTVLEGSVRKAGNRLRITAQLVNVADGYHLWSERFDRNIDDVFADSGRDRAARSPSRLRVTLTPPRDRDDGEAGDLHEPRGVSTSICAGASSSNKFADLFGSLTGGPQAASRRRSRSIPMYSAVYAGLAECLYRAWLHHASCPAPEAQQGRARGGAARASRSIRSLPEGHTALGWTKTLFAMDLRTAERDFQRALEISPGYAPAHGYYALLLCGLRPVRRGPSITPRRPSHQIRCG